MGWCGPDATAYAWHARRQFRRKRSVWILRPWMDISFEPLEGCKVLLQLRRPRHKLPSRQEPLTSTDCRSPTRRHGIVRYRPKTNTGSCGRVGDPNLHAAGGGGRTEVAGLGSPRHPSGGADAAHRHVRATKQAGYETIDLSRCLFQTVGAWQCRSRTRGCRARWRGRDSAVPGRPVPPLP